MPITVQHGQPLGDYAALFEFIAAEAERRKRLEDQRRAAQEQLFQRFAPPTQAAPPVARQPLAPNGQPAAPVSRPDQPLSPADRLKAILALEDMKLKRDQAAADSRARQAQAFYGQRGGGGRGGSSDTAVASILNNLIDNAQQGATQRAIADRQMASLQATGERQVLLSQLDAAESEVNDLMGRDLDPEIQQQLNDGLLHYTREDEREMAAIERDISRVDSATNLTELEKARAKLDLARRYWRLRNSHKKNPNPPITTAQRFEQETHVDENGVRWSPGRNPGEWLPREVKNQQAELDLKIQAAKQKQSDVQYKAHTDAIEREADARIYRSERILDLQSKIIDTQLKMSAAEAKAAEINSSVDHSAIKKHIEKLQKEVERLEQEGSLGPGMPPAPIGFPKMNGQQAAPTAPIPVPPADEQQFTIIGPNPAGRYAKKYADGRIELLPEGFAP